MADNAGATTLGPARGCAVRWSDWRAQQRCCWAHAGGVSRSSNRFVVQAPMATRPVRRMLRSTGAPAESAAARLAEGPRIGWEPNRYLHFTMRRHLYLNREVAGMVEPQP